MKEHYYSGETMHPIVHQIMFEIEGSLWDKQEYLDVVWHYIQLLKQTNRLLNLNHRQVSRSVTRYLDLLDNDMIGKYNYELRKQYNSDSKSITSLDDYARYVQYYGKCLKYLY